MVQKCLDTRNFKGFKTRRRHKLGKASGVKLVAKVTSVCCGDPLGSKGAAESTYSLWTLIQVGGGGVMWAPCAAGVVPAGIFPGHWVCQGSLSSYCAMVPFLCSPYCLGETRMCCVASGTGGGLPACFWLSTLLSTLSWSSLLVGATWGFWVCVCSGSFDLRDRGGGSTCSRGVKQPHLYKMMETNPVAHGTCDI